jgi:hypothetical protein
VSTLRGQVVRARDEERARYVALPGWKKAQLALGQAALAESLAFARAFCPPPPLGVAR